MAVAEAWQASSWPSDTHILTHPFSPRARALAGYFLLGTSDDGHFVTLA